MTAPRPVPRWELQRQQWAAPTSTIHALRRARARAAYNRRRQEQARGRLRMLAGLLRRNGFDPQGDLRGAGNKGLYRQYYEACGRSYRTYLRDLAYFRANGRLAAGAEWPSTSPHQSVAPPLSVSRCPTCGRARGMPARSPASTPPSPWYVISLALFRALTEMLPAPMEEAVFERARHHLARLRLPKRVWAAVQSVASAPKPAPPPPPPSPAPSPWPTPPSPVDAGPPGDGVAPPAGPNTMTTTMLLHAMFGPPAPVPPAADREARPRATPSPSSSSDARPPLPPRRPPAPPPRDPCDWW